ncbi:MAG: hypothetical protein JXR68_14140 [Bacteroidales bacterium]|nr:hypothetical protein [Bacteroidales bacterium]
MICVGYCIGSGFSYGVDITLGILDIQQGDFPTTMAVSTKYYFFNLAGYSNRVLSFNLLVENQYNRIGFGISEIKRKWGFKNRNIHKAYGFTTDFGLHAGPYQIPWFGFRTITPLVASDWLEKKSFADFYTYFKYENIQLLK